MRTPSISRKLRYLGKEDWVIEPQLRYRGLGVSNPLDLVRPSDSHLALECDLTVLHLRFARDSALYSGRHRVS